MANEDVVVGSTDDPTAVTNPVGAGARRRARPLIAGLMVVAVSAVVLASLIGGGHPGGDPGGVVLAMLSKVRQAVPPAASAVSDHVDPAQWFPGCGAGSQAGWGNESVDVEFTDGAPSHRVVATVNAVLVRQGWQRHDEATGPGQGRIAHWSLDIAGQRRADAFTYPVPAGSTTWFLTATWRPPGPVAGGCG